MYTGLDVCLLLNLGLLTEERARIVAHPYLLYVLDC
jgi:hypothetical protein